MLECRVIAVKTDSFPQDHTSCLDFLSAASYQFVDFLRLDRFARPGVGPLGLCRRRVGLIVGTLLLLGAILPFEPGEDTGHAGRRR